ncbi:MAG: hypothetical protein H7836_04655 [Magnetococcus sp. YQC-3]
MNKIHELIARIRSMSKCYLYGLVIHLTTNIIIFIDEHEYTIHNSKKQNAIILEKDKYIITVLGKNEVIAKLEEYIIGEL